MARPLILVVDDEANILATVRRALELEDYRVEVAGSGKLALEKAAAISADAVMLDVAMPEQDGLTTLRLLKAREPELPVVMMSGQATLQVAVEATRLGAADFLEKPLSSEKMLITLQNVLRLAQLERENREEKRRRRDEFAMIGSGAAMQRVYDQLRKAAPSNARVLITGERGTGKELVAHAVHEHSKRASGPFIKMNCAAIPSELIESELFGHEKGAFTGATKERRGKFELAHQGTLFLDEIGDMTQSAQAKVLRVLQEGEIERVGGSEPLRVDVRVIAATNKGLRDEIDAGRFRADLFDRLNVVPIELPSLRKRREDIPSLVDHFLTLAATANGKAKPRITEEGKTLLQQHDWPGNVRELRNTIERLVIFSDQVIDENAVREVLPGAKLIRGRYERGVALKDLVASAEREIVLGALQANEFKMSDTARELGLERSHLYKKVKALGITLERDEDDDSPTS
jgi:DNA-binding NtrC family response regulator